jgi:hypothetical protein
MTNPYAAALPGNGPGAIPDGSNESAKHYQARLTWSDRRFLLRSIVAIRIAIVLDTLVWLMNLAQWVPYLRNVILGNGAVDSMRPDDAVLSLIWFALHPLALWMCWLCWRNANMLREVAGGATATMSDWCQMIHRLAWLGVLSAALYFATYIGGTVQWVIALLE